MSAVVRLLQLACTDLLLIALTFIMLAVKSINSFLPKTHALRDSFDVKRNMGKKVWCGKDATMQEGEPEEANTKCRQIRALWQTGAEEFLWVAVISSPHSFCIANMTETGFVGAPPACVVGQPSTRLVSADGCVGALLSTLEHRCLPRPCFCDPRPRDPQPATRDARRAPGLPWGQGTTRTPWRRAGSGCRCLMCGASAP